jgi:tetratricopeptide (TPR) repeat protein
MAADLFNNWALVHFLGDIARAETLTRQALELRRSIEAPQSMSPTTVFNLAGILYQLGRWEEAERSLEETIRTAAAREEQRTERDAMLELAGVYIETGRLAAATAMLEQVESRLDALPRGAVWGRAQLGYYRGRLALAQGDFVAARDHFTGAIEVFTRHSAKIAMNVLTLIGLVDTELALADHEQAMRRAREALATAESFVEPDELSYLVGHAYAALARAQSGSGQPDAARESLTKALRHLEATLGSEHPATRAASDALHRLCRPDAIDSDSSI